MDLIGALSSAAGGAAGGGGGTYIEDVFSTYLYAGNGSTQTITNGIDLDGEGGLVWARQRNDLFDHSLFDTERGVDLRLRTNTTNAETTNSGWISSFNSDGFSLGSGSLNSGGGANYVSWTFRKAPKFFDVVTYTGTGSARTVSHNLGSVPGCIIVKRTDSTGDWIVYHRANTANPETDYLELNDTAATADLNTMWNDTAPTSTEFTVGTDADVNASAATYVAYLFAHDAGGFGDDGSENVITCGSFTTDGSGNATVTLGYEPQLGIAKASSGTSTWVIIDNMRGMTTAGVANAQLFPNTSAAEASGSGYFNTTSTGFTFAGGGSSVTWIYIAIRRGPMKTPTAGTEVYNAITRTGTNTAATVTGVGFVPDTIIARSRLATTSPAVFIDRLRGHTKYLQTPYTDAEITSSGASSDMTALGMDGFSLGTSGTTDLNTSGALEVYEVLRRAPGFFDVVAYTGTGSATTISHNLGVVPELIIVKNRDQADAWQVYAGDATDYLVLNTTAATADNVDRWNDTAPTSSVFTIGTAVEVNTSTEKYIAYLFASLAGISKVGSYTGTGTTLAIDCGFSAGARFVMIKRTDSTGDWYVWDSARGIVSGNDPYLLLNSTAAEVTNTDYIDPSSAGFEITSTAPAAINASGGTFIFLAIA